jgi:hypothetical protein
MELHRLKPTELSNPTRRYAGRCGACDRRIDYREEVVHLYGEAFHVDCAFYRRSWNERPRPNNA